MSKVVLDILNGGAMPAQLNHTNVVLIPKVTEPMNMVNFRPISLCNVIYKLVTKVITNRLKNLLLNIISETQSVFTPGRLIIDHFLVSYENFHSMHIHGEKNGSMAIKLDMAKSL